MNGRAIQPVMADIMAVHLTSSRPRYIPSSACKTVGLPENEERKIRATFWYGTFQQLICLDWLFQVFCSYCKMGQLHGFIYLTAFMDRHESRSLSMSSLKLLACILPEWPQQPLQSSQLFETAHGGK